MLSLCFNCHYFLIGTQKLELVNSYGFKLDLSLFAMVSSIISIAGILFSASWTTKPIQNQTHVLVAFLAFLPLFLFRMLSWLLIITCLDLFSFIIIIGLLVLNWIVLILTQDRLHSEPLKQSLLSLVFPVYELPTSNTDPTRGLKFLFCLTLSGNIYLAAMLATGSERYGLRSALAKGALAGDMNDVYVKTFNRMFATREGMEALIHQTSSDPEFSAELQNAVREFEEKEGLDLGGK